MVKKEYLQVITKAGVTFDLAVGAGVMADMQAVMMKKLSGSAIAKMGEAMSGETKLSIEVIQNLDDETKKELAILERTQTSKLISISIRKVDGERLRPEEREEFVMDFMDEDDYREVGNVLGEVIQKATEKDNAMREGLNAVGELDPSSPVLEAVMTEDEGFSAVTGI
jgi:hypothetical protein